jgi:hypothetical protein
MECMVSAALMPASGLTCTAQRYMPEGAQASDTPPALLRCYQECDTALTTAQNLMQESKQRVQQLQQLLAKLKAPLLDIESQLQAVGLQLSNNRGWQRLSRDKKRAELMYTSLKQQMQETEQELERQCQQASEVQQILHQGRPAEQQPATCPHDLQPWVRAAVAGAEALHLIRTAMEAHEKKDAGGYTAAALCFRIHSSNIAFTKVDLILFFEATYKQVPTYVTEV